jgi:hypothetical protein
MFVDIVHRLVLKKNGKFWMLEVSIIECKFGEALAKFGLTERAAFSHCIHDLTNEEGR